MRRAHWREGRAPAGLSAALSLCGGSNRRTHIKGRAVRPRHPRGLWGAALLLSSAAVFGRGRRLLGRAERRESHEPGVRRRPAPLRLRSGAGPRRVCQRRLSVAHCYRLPVPLRGQSRLPCSLRRRFPLAGLCPPVSGQKFHTAAFGSPGNALSLGVWSGLERKSEGSFGDHDRVGFLQKWPAAPVARLLFTLLLSRFDLKVIEHSADELNSLKVSKGKLLQ